jgi:uncharacterized protein
VPADLLPQYPVADVERVTLGTDDVPTLLVRPESPGPHPGAILQHGYASEKAALLPLARPLAALGFVVLLADAWGHGERFPTSGPNWLTDMHADYALEVIRHTVDDVRAGITALAERPDVQSDRILVGGFSLGAVVSLIAGVEDPRPAAVISMAGSPLPDLLGVKRFDSRPPSDATRRYAQEHDAAAHIARLAPRPLLLSHGRADDLVPLAGALRLYDAAKPLYAERPHCLALQLYDHRHDVSERQLRDAVAFIARFFLVDEVPADAGSPSAQTTS